jgi:hypothetical protein
MLSYIQHTLRSLSYIQKSSPEGEERGVLEFWFELMRAVGLANLHLISLCQWRPDKKTATWTTTKPLFASSSLSTLLSHSLYIIQNANTMFVLKITSGHWMCVREHLSSALSSHIAHMENMLFMRHAAHVNWNMRHATFHIILGDIHILSLLCCIITDERIASACVRVQTFRANANMMQLLRSFVYYCLMESSYSGIRTRVTSHRNFCLRHFDASKISIHALIGVYIISRMQLKIVAV